VELLSQGTVLATWTFGAGVYSNLEYASITLTSTTWSATVVSATESDESGTRSGTFATALDPSAWTGFYIGLQATPGSSTASRVTDGYIGSITIGAVPEPATAGLFLAGFAGLVVSALLVKRRCAR
jgi:hypothetical protein